MSGRYRLSGKWRIWNWKIEERRHSQISRVAAPRKARDNQTPAELFRIPFPDYGCAAFALQFFNMRATRMPKKLYAQVEE